MFAWFDCDSSLIFLLRTQEEVELFSKVFKYSPGDFTELEFNDEIIADIKAGRIPYLVDMYEDGTVGYYWASAVHIDQEYYKVLGFPIRNHRHPKNGQKKVTFWVIAPNSEVAIERARMYYNKIDLVVGSEGLLGNGPEVIDV